MTLVVEQDLIQRTENFLKVGVPVLAPEMRVKREEELII
jgi:hypothetical protein